VKLINYVLIIFLVLGILGFSGIAFAQDSITVSEGTLDANPSDVIIHGFVPVLKGVKISGDDIEAFMAMPLEDKIFVIAIGLALLMFIIWYTLKGKYTRLSLRIPIIFAWLLLIFVPLYWLGNMMYFIVAVMAILVVLMTTWYYEHGRHMSKTRLIGVIGGVCLLLVLVVGLPAYYYFTASEDIAEITVASKNANLEIVDYKVYRNTFTGSDIKFEGYVKNNGNKAIEFVQINVTGYDVAGNIVTNKTTFVDDNTLLAGSTSPFGELSSYYGGYLEDPQQKIVRIKLEAFTDF